MQNFKFAEDLGPRANLFLCVLGRSYLSESFYKRNIKFQVSSFNFQVSKEEISRQLQPLHEVTVAHDEKSSQDLQRSLFSSWTVTLNKHYVQFSFVDKSDCITCTLGPWSQGGRRPGQFHKQGPWYAVNFCKKTKWGKETFWQASRSATAFGKGTQSPRSMLIERQVGIWKVFFFSKISWRGFKFI